MITGDGISLRPLRMSDADFFAETMADWPGRVVDGVPVPNSPLVCEVECRRWVSIHSRGVGHAYVALAPDPVGVVLFRVAGDEASGLIVALHPAHRGAGHYRRLDALLQDHFVGGGVVSRATFAILPTAAAVQRYRDRDGWRRGAVRAGETGQDVEDVEIDADIYAAKPRP